MANLFGLGATGALLGHCFKFHLECNTLFSWLNYMFEYSEAENGVRLMIEFCKIQLFVAIGSNIQDVYNYTSSSYFIQQEHSANPEYEDLPEDFNE